MDKRYFSKKKTIKTKLNWQWSADCIRQSESNWIKQTSVKVKEGNIISHPAEINQNDYSTFCQSVSLLCTPNKVLSKGDERKPHLYPNKIIPGNITLMNPRSSRSFKKAYDNMRCVGLSWLKKSLSISLTPGFEYRNEVCQAQKTQFRTQKRKWRTST